MPERVVSTGPMRPASSVILVVDVDPRDPWEVALERPKPQFHDNQFHLRHGQRSSDKPMRIPAGAPVAVYDRDGAYNPLNVGWLDRYSRSWCEELNPPAVLLSSDQFASAEIDVARWYFHNLYGLRLGVCDREECLNRILYALAGVPSLNRLLAAFCFRHRGYLDSRHIGWMLHKAYSHRTIIRAMDAHGVPR